MTKIITKNIVPYVPPFSWHDVKVNDCIIVECDVELPGETTSCRFLAFVVNERPDTSAFALPNRKEFQLFMPECKDSLMWQFSLNRLSLIHILSEVTISYSL